MADWELGLDTWATTMVAKPSVGVSGLGNVMQSGLSPLECDMITADSTFGSLVLCQGLKFTRNTRGPEVSQPAFWRVDQSLATAGSGVPASLPR